MPIDSYGSSPQNPYLNPTPEVHTPQEPLQDKPLSSTNQEHSTGSNNDPELAAHMADMYGSTSTLPDQQHPTTIYGYPTTGPGSAGGTYDPHAILQRRYEQQSHTTPWSSRLLMQQDRIRFTKLMLGHIQPAVVGEDNPSFRLSKPISTMQGCVVITTLWLLH